MPTTLGNPYSLDWRGNPPHMLQPDIPVWYRFLEVYGASFLSLWYDVLLGGPPLTPQDELDPMKRMWRANLAKRADAIAELSREIWIIEVTADPGLRSIGQLQTYRLLWIRDPKIQKPEKMVLVAETIEPDLLDAASSYGILNIII